MQTKPKKAAPVPRRTTVPAAANPAGQAKGGTSATAGDGEQPTDAVGLLEQEHHSVAQLFASYEGLDSALEKHDAARRICAGLVSYARLEEELFYPSCREKGGMDDVLDKAQVEHDVAKLLIEELLGGSPEEEYYDAKVAVLREQIEHHVREEEHPRTGIFAKASAAGVDMNELGQRVLARKQELMAEGEVVRASPAVSLQQVLGNANLQEEHEMASQYERGRDENGRFASDDRGSRSSRARYDDDEDRGGRSHGGSDRDRDDYGRFVSDDRGSRSSRSRYDDDDDRGGRSRSSASDRDRDDYGRFVSEDRGSRSSRSRDDEEDGRGHGRGGWFGDSRGHSQAAREGWRNR